jgi:hypothetical protein
LGDINHIQFYDMMQLCIKQNFIFNFRRRESHTLLELVHDPVHEAESSSSPTTISNNYKSLKFTKSVYNSLKATISH